MVKRTSEIITYSISGIILFLIIAGVSFRLINYSEQETFTIKVVKHNNVMNISRVHFYRVNDDNGVYIKKSDLQFIAFKPGYDFKEGAVYHIVYVRKIPFHRYSRYPSIINVDKLS